jgi:hypothetical protein
MPYVEDKIMNLTVTKIAKELEPYGYEYILNGEHRQLMLDIIKDTLSIIDKKLIKHKGISIKGKKI